MVKDGQEITNWAGRYRIRHLLTEARSRLGLASDKEFAEWLTEITGLKVDKNDIVRMRNPWRLEQKTGAPPHVWLALEESKAILKPGTKKPANSSWLIGVWLERINPWEGVDDPVDYESKESRKKKK
jgi:hypothetical protein